MKVKSGSLRKSLKKSKKNFAALIITISVFILAAIIDFFGILDYVEYKTYDLRVRQLSKYSRPSDDIVVVLLDQASIDWGYKERGWSWPWPRKAYGEFLEYMNKADAASVSFDILFSEPSLYGKDDDNAFANAGASFGRMVQTVFFSTQTGNTFTWPEKLKTPLFECSGFEEIFPAFEFYLLSPPPGAQFPVEALLDSAAVVGNVTGKSDSDGIFRRLPLFVLFDNKAVPGLSSAALLASGMDNNISYDKKKRAIFWGDYSVPIDKNGKALLRFRGSLDRYYPYSAAAILQSAEDYRQGREPEYLPEDFSGRHIFFGYYAPGLFDICSSPVSSVYPGMGMHITMLDNLLQQDFIKSAPAWFALSVVFAVVALVNFITLYSGRISFAVAGISLAAGLIIGGAVAAYAAGYWVPMMVPLSAALAAFLSSTLYNYSTEGSQKRFIKSAFSQYLSPTVIDKLIADPERLSLGGERREISIFFSDVQGFTSISEKLDPAKLTELLNSYLSFMTDIILESGGTIDKYEGDAIIAFWNAPVDQTDHPARALGASLECQRKLAQQQNFFEEKFGFKLVTRIGLNTGYAVVGNMGSSKRFDYTMLGDSVNLAARLEGLNKQFGTYIMCTKTTMEKANQHSSFNGRKLADVAVVGKKEAVTVYEPMTEENFCEKEELLRMFDEARDSFYKGEFVSALQKFEALADKDAPSFYYARQCGYYIANPMDWKGFWQATSK